MGNTVLKALLPIALLWIAHASAAPVRIMPLGDSITHGWYSGIGTDDLDSYRKVLKTLLDAEGYTTDFVGSLSDGSFTDHEHEGHDGCFADHPTSSNKLIGNVGGWMASTPADVVFYTSAPTILTVETQEPSRKWQRLSMKL